MTEEYKIVPSFPKYGATFDGRLIKLKTGRMLNPYTNPYGLVKKGYWHSQTCKDFKVVKFKNGYGSNVPSITVECLGISLEDMDAVNPKWFGQFSEYEGIRIFVIKLGKILHIENYKP